MKSLTLAFAFATFAGAATNASAVEGNAETAKGKISMCAGCHGIPGYRTAVETVYHVPKLGGQHPKYIVAALQAYKKGDRVHPTMRAIATGLSEQDMADMAVYYGARNQE